jgi:hypothetical protein
MANVKITDLVAYTDPVSTDVLAVVDIGADITKKVSIADLLENAGSGTAAAPGIAFDGDSNTGIYRPGANQLAISTNGTGRLFVDASGNVGVGTASNLTKLSVAGLESANPSRVNIAVANNANRRLTISQDTILAEAPSAYGTGANQKIEFNPATGRVNFYTANTPQMTLDSSGRLGLGTSTQTAKLELSANNNGVTQNNTLRFIDTDGSFSAGQSPGRIEFVTSDADNPGVTAYIDTYGYTNAASDIVFGTGIGGSATERLRITYNGKLGLGTSTPDSNLVVKGATGDVELKLLTHNGISQSRLLFADNSGVDGVITYNHNDRKLLLGAGTSSPTDADVTITAAGRVGIGTTSPNVNAKLSVSNGGAETFEFQTGVTSGKNTLLSFNRSTSAWVEQNYGASAHTFNISGGSNEVARIDSSGRLLVGTSSEITGSAHYKLQSTGIAGAYIGLGRNDSAVAAGEGLGGVAFYGNDGGSYEQCASILAQADGTHAAGDKPTRLVFSTAAAGSSTPTERMRITSDGKLGLGTSAPSADLDIFNTGFVNLKVRSSGTSSASLNLINSTRNYSINSSNGALTFYDATAGTERLRIDSSGRLGLGTSIPQAKMEIVENAGGLDLVTPLRLSGTAVNNDDGWKLQFYNNTAAQEQGSLLVQYKTVGFWKTSLTSTDNVTFDTAGNERVRIDSSGRVGIGTTSVSAGLHVVQDINPVLKLDRGTANSTNANLYYNGTLTGQLTAANADFQISAAGASTPMSFYVNGSQRAAIDSSGRLLVGTSANFGAGADNRDTIVGLANAGAGLLLGRNDTSTSEGNNIGKIEFWGNDSDGEYEQCASIIAEADSDHGTGDKPTRLAFSTTADGDSSPTERMRIKSDGDVYVGTANAITGSANGLQIRSVGELRIGRATVATITHIGFYNPNGLVGSITTTTSSTAYNTSSDYRLKENVVPLTGAADRLKQLKPSQFNFIADPSKTVDGFLAHEAQAVVPECVTGAKDAVDDEGNPVYQGIDQSKLVPLLTAALQEALVKIETLEQRLNDAGIA